MGLVGGCTLGSSQLQAALLKRDSIPSDVLANSQDLSRYDVIEPTLEDDLLFSDSESVRHAQSASDKVKNFEDDFSDDVFLNAQERIVMASTFARLKRLEKLVGHGNYNVLGFDEALKYAKYYSQVGHFTPVELEMIDRLFNTKASVYGFFGDKVIPQLSARIKSRDVKKIPYSGHYLFRGESLVHYEKLKKDIGKNVILTSGVRSNVKQIHLFMAKTIASEYNLSKASRSLAPPGHSYHGIGDYDVGKIGWGHLNFTDKFSQSAEYKKMQRLGYVQIRYTEDNLLGVRFEPWHIKVV